MFKLILGFSAGACVAVLLCLILIWSGFSSTSAPPTDIGYVSLDPDRTPKEDSSILGKSTNVAELATAPSTVSPQPVPTPQPAPTERVSQEGLPSSLVRLSAPPPEQLDKTTLQLWKNARDAIMGAAELKQLNGVGVAGRVFWNFAYLQWHALPDSFDDRISDAWQDLLSRVCDRPIEVDSEELARVFRKWSTQADDLATETYRAYGLDPRNLGLYRYSERKEAKREIIDTFGMFLEDFSSDVSSCLKSREDIDAWNEFVHWLTG